jgi:hypothetical protein
MKQNILIGCALACVIFSACRKEDDIFDGPSLNDIYGEFSFIQEFDIVDRDVDFGAGETTAFTAEFSKNMQWKVEITGLTTGAVKVIEGTSNVLDVTNTQWNGSTTTLPMFQAEMCAVMLTFTTEPDTIFDTLEVISPKNNAGLLISDFESGWNPGWNSFVQSGADMSFIITEDVQAAQGNKYYDMGGAVDWDWLIGLVNIPATAYGAPTFALNSNPANVYFNVMLYNPPGITNSLVLFQFREDDNEDGVFTEGEEDMFSIEVRMTQPGWQLISSQYQELPTLVNGAVSDPLGNGIYEPHKLYQVSVLMLADPTSGYSQAFMDYMIFTEGNALEP